MCGENSSVAPVYVSMTGSSPRVRGKLIGCAGVRVDDGLIPACAGKTVNIPHCICEEPAHPRACGENFIPRPRAAPFGGSSPRMRGKLMAKRAASRRAGLIPAHAGKTLGGIRFRWSAWAHPRVCGENPPAFYCRYGHPGSSPRMRGKR